MNPASFVASALRSLSLSSSTLARRSTTTLLLGLILLGGCQSTSPYLRIDPEGDDATLSIAWLRMECEGRPDIHLVNMVHVGEAAYYREVQKTLDATSTVFLEGVRGDGPMRLISKAHTRFAKLLRLELQGRSLERRPHWKRADADEAALGSVLMRQAVDAQFGVAKLDRLLERRGRRLERERGLDPGEGSELLARGPLRRLCAKQLLVDEPDESDPILIDARNQLLFDGLLEELNGETEIAICYGVGHAAGIHAWLRKRGYETTSTTWQPIWQIEGSETLE